MKQITVGKNTYRSISEAWRELSPEGLPEITVRWRLRKGWNALLAFTHMPVPPKDRRTFADVRR